MNKPQIIPALTSMRGLAALFVLFYHVAGSFSNFEFGFFKLFHSGHLSVDLFFVLSGFIMHHVYFTPNRIPRFTTFFKSFMISRMARLYPLHIVTLLFLLFIIIVVPGYSDRYASESFSPISFLFNLFLIQNWGFIGPSWNLVSWSISAEWFMYLLFPFILVCSQYFPINKIKWIYLFFTLLILSTHYLLIYFLDLNGYGGISLGGMIRVSFEFSLGFCVYGFRCFLVRNETLRQSNTISALLLILIFTSITWSSFYYLFLPSVALFILNLSLADNVISRQFERKTMMWLGEISYSLYMWHYIVIQIGNYLLSRKFFIIEENIDLVIFFITVTAISLILAHYSHMYVEKKGQRFILNVFKSKKREALIVQ
jgi:peptidoglycan/LPS O-acetylase OafA/YrhL